jgi:sugar/nucleoside kinase (ribokinase family)
VVFSVDTPRRVGQSEDVGSSRASREPPDVVVVGHLTVDELPGGLRPGGSVLYAGLMAHRQGLRVGVLTSHGPDFPPGILPPEVEVVSVPAPATTRFALHYTPAGRTLTLRARAAALEPAHLPPHFAEAGIAYLAPVADEVSPGLAAAFPEAAVGVGAQGWCRRWDRSGAVTMRPWTDPAGVLQRAQALFLSSDDVAGWEDQALELYQQVPVGALTLAARGALLYVNGERHHIPPVPASETEPTGAGDVFAAAFLIRYNASGDPLEAAALAAVAGALTVEAEGIRGVPTAERLEARWREAQLR